MEQTFLNTSLWNRLSLWNLLYGIDPCIFFIPDAHFNATSCLFFAKKNFIFHILFKSKKMVFIDLWNTVSHVFLFLRLFQDSQKWKVVKVSQKYIDNLLTYFYLPTWAVYLCSATVKQSLQVMACCISVVSYDRCATHHNFPMTCLLWIIVQCVF